MPFEEKIQWVYGAVAIIVPIAYLAVVLPQLATTPASEIAFQRPMIIAIITSIVLTILGSIVAAIFSAIGAQITGGDPNAIDRKDERDVLIGHRGELVGYYVTSVGVVGALILTLLETDYFWIANALYLTFAVAAVVSAIVKIVAYRRGF